jgi:hypothetical protein
MDTIHALSLDETGGRSGRFYTVTFIRSPSNSHDTRSGEGGQELCTYIKVSGLKFYILIFKPAHFLFKLRPATRWYMLELHIFRWTYVTARHPRQYTFPPELDPISNQKNYYKNSIIPLLFVKTCHLMIIINWSKHVLVLVKWATSNYLKFFSVNVVLTIMNNRP